MKKLLCLLGVYSVCVNAVEYSSLPNEVLIDETNVTIKMLQIDEESPSCLESGVVFPVDSISADTWINALMVARQQQQFLDFSYDDSNCALSSINLPALYNNQSGVTGSGPLDETGLNGNVALIGSNNIEAASITSSGYYGKDEPAAAFDGHTYTAQLNDDSLGKIARGIWLENHKTGYTSNDKPWIEVDFGEPVIISSLGIFINAQSLGLGRLPRTISVHYSIDGNEYNKITEYTLAKSEVNTLQLTTSTKGRMFRIYVENNFGDAKFIEIDELEFYQ